MLRRRLGHRAPLLWLALPVMAGLAAGKFGAFAPVRGQLALALTFALAAIGASWRASRAWAPALVAAMFCAGSASYALHRARSPDWDAWPSREARLALRIDHLFPHPDRRSLSGLGTIVRTDAHLRALVGQRVYFSLTPRKGEAAPIRSTVVSAVGVLVALPWRAPANTFDGYLVDAGLNFRFARARLLATERPPTRYHVFLERTAVRLNAWLSAGIATKRPALAAVYRAMMLGQKYELSEEQDTLFMRSGTMHLFAINGLHIGVVAVTLHALLALLRVPRPLAAVVTLAVLWIDVDATGASPSAVRAFLLVACHESALVLRRPGNGLAALATAALSVLLVQPMAVFSASFQMSYGVVFAILCFGLPLTERLQEKLAPFRDLPAVTWSRAQRGWAAALRKLWPMIGIGVAATLVSAITAPAFFQVFAPAGFFSNLGLIPLASLVIVAGFASVLAGGFGATPLGLLFNHAALLVLVGIDGLIRRSVQLPAAWWTAQWRADWAPPGALALLLATMLAGYAGGWQRERGGWWPPFVVVVVALLAGIKLGN